MMDNRNELMVKMRMRGVSFPEIGKIFGITRQRAHQIITGYRSPTSPKISVENLKIWNVRKRKSLGLPDQVLNGNGLGGGRDFIRELARIRDNHTCQICGLVWVKGNRRLDVHHTKEKMEGRSSERGSIKRDKESIDKMITLCHSCHLNLDSVKKKMHTNAQGRVLTNVKNGNRLEVWEIKKQ